VGFSRELTNVGQGFTPCRRIFFRRGVKPRPTLSPIFLVGQGFIPCRQIFSARCKTAPYIEPNFLCRAGFHTLPTNFFSARCETAPYIEPNFPCRAGFYTLPTNFFRRGVKPRPTLSRFSFVGQGFIPCRQNFSARCETAPYMLIFIGRAGTQPFETIIFGSAIAEPSEFTKDLLRSRKVYQFSR